MFKLVSLFYEVVPGVLTEQGKVGRRRSLSPSLVISDNWRRAAAVQQDIAWSCHWPG